MISLDTETTGLDLRHGARPFLVTTCSEDGDQDFWEWDVDPLTRGVAVVESDLEEINQALVEAVFSGGLALQNAKFDVTALATLGGKLAAEWPWGQTFDTLVAGHLLGSNQRHDLTAMALMWLDKDIRPWEREVEEAVKKCRSMVQQERARIKRGKVEGGMAAWRIADRDLEEMPSAKETVWMADAWLPRAVAREHGLPKDHPYWSVTHRYANVDSSVTLALAKVQREEIRRRGLEEIFAERMRMPAILHRMERRGVTVSGTALCRLRERLARESADGARSCVGIATELGYDLTLPKGAAGNESLHQFCFGRVEETSGPVFGTGSGPSVGTRRQQWLRLPVVKTTETGKASLDKECFATWLETLDPATVQHRFVKALSEKRRRDTGLSFLDAYERFMLPLTRGCEAGAPVNVLGWHLLHPSFNQTGTDTLRMSCHNPNAQQISKQEASNLRHCFGPAPGREWWSFDAANLELRIPTYEAGEPELIEVFDHPERPPFYGSFHMVVFAALWPELWEDALRRHGPEGAAKFCKVEYEAAQYQWTKNFDFSVIYGCQEAKGDATAHKRGAWRANRERFPRIAVLSDRQKAFADRHGRVDTMPDRSIYPEGWGGEVKGYPLLCSRTEYGRVSPTIPLNYRVSGTACWWMARAMVKVEERLQEWRADGWDGAMILNVHDEIVLDVPRGRGAEPWRTNLPRMRAVKALMESCGDDIGVPTPVSMEFHDVSWAEGKPL